MKQYFLGADVGATKTHVLITDEEGAVAGFGEAGPGNHETVGYSGLQMALSTATDQALMKAGIGKEMISGSGFGIAGYDWPSEKEETYTAIKSLGLKSNIEIVNDTILGLVAGSPQGWGIAVVSGTGCNCRGWNKSHSKEGRVVGRSTLVGEGAGGTEVMEKVLQAIAYEWTLRGSRTDLTRIMIKKVGAQNTEDFLEGVCEGRYNLNPSDASVVFQVASEGDSIARAILTWAGCELGEMVNAVVRQLEFEHLDFDVVLVGSMFKGGQLLLEPMGQTIHALAPGAKLIHLSTLPVVGALLLGMESANYVHSLSVYEKITATIEKFL
jgi:N-acetylglucosamine kinase-like BadF-type ATPase